MLGTKDVIIPVAIDTTIIFNLNPHVDNTDDTISAFSLVYLNISGNILGNKKTSIDVYTDLHTFNIINGTAYPHNL